MDKKVRTRFAPSPTGPLHMGGVRTALYNYLFSRKNGGDFLLRIEDTDQNRYVEGAESYIVESLQWCGIIPDESPEKGGRYGPYRQSERKEKGIYEKYAVDLVASGHAYYAFDTPDELEEMRKRLNANGVVAPQYNHESRMSMKNSLTIDQTEVKDRIANGEHYVIRLKVDPGETISFNDLIRGEVSFRSDIVDDKVLLKSDGMPTYHLAHIVDDVLMEITHTIRGEEWLPSAPAHQLIYKFLNWTDRQPVYAHLPLLLKPDGNGKLSKRDGDRLGFPVFPLEWKDPKTGDISSGYREQGYYPEAFVNLLALLGWNPGTEQELFTMDELINAFSFEHVHKAGARFDPEKARWFNEQYLRKQSLGDIATRLKETVAIKFSLSPESKQLTHDFLMGVAALTVDRVHFESEIPDQAEYLFIAPSSYDDQVINKKWKPELKPYFEDLTSEFSALSAFDKEHIDQTVKSVCSHHSRKPGEVMQLLRVFISGKGAGVDLIGMLELLGREEAASRLKNALNGL